jgi:hypothetical protein
MNNDILLIRNRRLLNNLVRFLTHNPLNKRQQHRPFGAGLATARRCAGRYATKTNINHLYD